MHKYIRTILLLSLYGNLGFLFLSRSFKPSPPKPNPRREASHSNYIYFSRMMHWRSPQFASSSLPSAGKSPLSRNHFRSLCLLICRNNPPSTPLLFLESDRLLLLLMLFHPLEWKKQRRPQQPLSRLARNLGVLGFLMWMTMGSGRPMSE